MKIMHEKVIFPGQSTINVKWSKFPKVSYPLHFHSEYEIVFVHESFGNYFVADSIMPFEGGELTLIGSHLPHFFDFDSQFRSGDPEFQVKVTVIHFPQSFFHQAFTEYPEFKAIQQLLTQAERGIHFSKTTSQKLEKKFLQLHQYTGFSQVILLLEILQLLAKEKDLECLASEGYQLEHQGTREERLNKVLSYLHYNYREDIRLKDVAEVASLHPTAFCRFFKEKTSRTFMEFVNELRVGYACKLLISSSMPISQICYESGFNNLSNFNRQFRSFTRFSPSEYQQQYLQNG